MTFPSIKKFLTPPALLVCLASCSKSSDVAPADANYVSIYSNQVISASDSSWQVSAVGAFKNNITGQLTTVQLLKINNRVLSPNPDNTYSYGYGDPPSASPEGLALAGTNVSVAIAGFSGGDTITQAVYLPKSIKASAKNFAGGGIDVSQVQSLTWMPDPNNAAGSVLIRVYYEPGLSHLSDSTLPATISTITYTVPDNGSYTLPQPGLKAFPNKSYIEISLTRQTQNVAVLPVSRKKIYCSGFSSASTLPLLVKNL